MNRVLVQKLKPTVQTKSGLFLPDSAKGPSNLAKVGVFKAAIGSSLASSIHVMFEFQFIFCVAVLNRYQQVLSVGAGRLSREGNRIPIDLKEGDMVVVPEYGGMPLKLDEEELHVFRDEDIIGIVKEDVSGLQAYRQPLIF